MFLYLDIDISSGILLELSGRCRKYLLYKKYRKGIEDIQDRTISLLIKVEKLLLLSVIKLEETLRQNNNVPRILCHSLQTLATKIANLTNQDDLIRQAYFKSDGPGHIFGTGIKAIG